MAGIVTVARRARAWLGRRMAPLLFLVTTAGLTAGGAAWLAGARGAADVEGASILPRPPSRPRARAANSALSTQ